MRLPGVQDKSANAEKRVLWVKELAEDCVMACVDNRGADSNWEQSIMIFNCSDRADHAQLPAGDWQVLADGEDSFLWQEETVLSGSAYVTAFSAMILGRK